MIEYKLNSNTKIEKNRIYRFATQLGEKFNSYLFNGMKFYTVSIRSWDGTSCLIDFIFIAVKFEFSYALNKRSESTRFVSTCVFPIQV